MADTSLSSSSSSSSSLSSSSSPSSSSLSSFMEEGMQMCPFLRNIREPTSFSFLASHPIPFPSLAKGTRGPIFEDGPNFETAFRIFHGHDGVVPLSAGGASGTVKVPESSKNESETGSVKFHPLAAPAASLSLSALGGSGPFSFDNFMSKKAANNQYEKMKKKKNVPEKQSTEATGPGHEAWSNDWLQTGNCPIAKSYRALNGVLPLVAKFLQPSPGMKLRCPPAIVAARAALAKTTAVKALRPQPLPARVLAVGVLGAALNIPLGVWREHTKKFSPSWFVAVHASVPFVAMMRKAVHMPKYVMAFTIAATILGQAVGARAERRRLEILGKESEEETPPPCDSHAVIRSKDLLMELENNANNNSLQCGKETWPKGKDKGKDMGMGSTSPIGAF